MKKFRPEQTRRRHDLLSDLAESAAHELCSHGMDPDEARVAGENIALAIHENWRGMSVVFPMHPELARQRLRSAVLAEYTGSNMAELVRKYNLAENTIYKWIKDDHEQRMDKRQFDLLRDNEHQRNA
jgi:Mor family transcriptional regulator